MVTLDVSKFTRNKIRDVEFKTAAGETVKRKEYEIEVVPLKPENVKVIASGPGWVKKKTHFACEAQTKEERLGKIPTIYVGEGFTFDKEDAKPVDIGIESEPNIDDIPF